MSKPLRPLKPLSHRPLKPLQSLPPMHSTARLRQSGGGSLGKHRTTRLQQDSSPAAGMVLDLLGDPIMHPPSRAKGGNQSPSPKEKAPRVKAQGFGYRLAAKPTDMELCHTPAWKIAEYKAIYDQHTGTGGLVQAFRLLVALRRFGRVNTFEAMRYLDVYDPRPRKNKLIKQGYNVLTQYAWVITESGALHCVGAYCLVNIASGFTRNASPAIGA